MKNVIYSTILGLCFICCYWSCSSDQNNRQNIVNQAPKAMLTSNTTVTNTASYNNFPTPLSPKTPYDIDMKLKNRLEAQKEFASVQRLFEIQSWQYFVAVNWPLDAAGKPMPNLSDKGKTTWNDWEESFEVFREDGSAPTAAIDYPDYAKSLNLKLQPKILFRTNKAADFHEQREIANEVDQAFSAPIWDQNGNIIRYEIRISPTEVDYLVNNELYNINGQIEFSKAGKKVVFPAGDLNTEGAIEIKLAWKILTKEDIPTRYLHEEAFVLQKDNTYKKQTVGLVGMHVAAKTVSSPQWIWSTFEHVDNLDTNPLEKVNGKSIKPSFYDPECPTCPINQFPDTTQAIVKNQIQRVLPINKATQALNSEVQGLLSQANSALQYYELIGTQWPTKPNKPPYKPTNGKYKKPDAITNKSGGFPTPVYLTNMVLETYFQGATDGNSYNHTIANEEAYHQIEQIKGFPKDQALIFGTESCMGCHYSASIAVDLSKSKGGKVIPKFGESGAADFSWLLSQKAHLKKRN